MSKRTTIITLGIFVAIMPFLGFPGTAKAVFFVIAGLVFAIIGYLLQTECEKCEVEEKNINTKARVSSDAEENEVHSLADKSIVNDNT